MIAAKVWNGPDAEPAIVEVSDLMKEDGIGVVVSLKTATSAINIQVDLLDAAELIASLTNAVRTQHEAMGVPYVRP